MSNLKVHVFTAEEPNTWTVALCDDDKKEIIGAMIHADCDSLEVVVYQKNLERCIMGNYFTQSKN